MKKNLSKKNFPTKKFRQKKLLAEKKIGITFLLKKIIFRQTKFDKNFGSKKVFPKQNFFRKKKFHQITLFKKKFVKKT